MSIRFNASNRLSLDYLAEARKFTKFNFPIIDAHSHINGDKAVEIYSKAAEAYNISLTYSMTNYSEIDTVQGIMGDRVRFITMPAFVEEEKYYKDVSGYLKYVEKFYEKGSRIIKFWSAPRGVDYGLSVEKPDLLKLGSKRRLEIMKHVSTMGMVFMVHVGDPDTWFTTKYSDHKKYGTKLDQYVPFEAMLEEFKVPTIAAHMCGWPENLVFLDGMLTKHSNLYLDTSATKWMVRELSRHPREEMLKFFRKWKGRILFGSDIVSRDDQTQDAQVAFDLYASRYWALRTLFEKKYNAESPIVDPDLAMVDPEKFSEDAAPQLIGKEFPEDILKDIYHDAAYNLLEKLHKNGR